MRTCSAELNGEQCQRKHYAKNYCSFHYAQHRKHGRITNIQPTTLNHSMRTRPAIERFAARIQPGGADMNCWVWTDRVGKNGYARFFDKGAEHNGHKWAWRTLVGESNSQQQLDHICRNPPCVRPSHLQPVTSSTHANLTKEQRGMLKANEESVIVGGNPKARSIQEITFALRHGLPGYLNGAKVIQK